MFRSAADRARVSPAAAEPLFERFWVSQAKRKRPAHFIGNRHPNRGAVMTLVLDEPRVLVCGSLRWAWTETAETVRDRLLARHSEDLVVIEGAATGADTAAHAWCERQGFSLNRHRCRRRPPLALHSADPGSAPAQSGQPARHRQHGPSAPRRRASQSQCLPPASFNMLNATGKVRHFSQSSFAARNRSRMASWSPGAAA
ncbi:SLOG family protein [Streptomyces sp. CY1]|uniref:SLOG family protein n=1 Tax=Streptomyces sp. CY1 TaxID=3388313 RepID=UPI0039A064DA